MTARPETELATFFEVSPDLLVIRDLQGRFVRVNNAWRTVLGYAPHELEGALMTDFVHPDDIAPSRRQQQNVLHAGIVDGFVNRFRHKQGHYRAFEWRATHVGDRVFGLARDVTDRLAAAAELEAARAAAESANKAKTEFLANMSHEIRTPLNGVIGLVASLERTSLTASQREMVALIRQSGETLADLVSDILDVSKIEAGRLELEDRPFDLGGELESLLDVHRRAATAKKLTFAVHGWAAGRFRGDPVRIRQILGNLLSNAVKFTDTGGVTVRLALEPAPGGVRLKARVEDTGIGFPSQAATQLFQRFSQGDASITRRFGGTGLGLAICRDLVAMMGGDIFAQSEPGRGSRFELVLPLAGDQTAADGLRPAPSAVDGFGRRLKVLLAEDHAVNQRVVQLLLEPLGAEVVIAADGRQALDAFRDQHFDLVLMDMQMPMMDGLSATRAIREHEAQTGRRTPIAMLSANAFPEHVQQAQDAGADVHIAKPLTPHSLIAGIRAALGEKP